MSHCLGICTSEIHKKTQRTYNLVDQNTVTKIPYSGPKTSHSPTKQSPSKNDNMFSDSFDNEPFNPFNVGPANSGGRSEYRIPTSVTYPPPVFVAKPEYVQAAAQQSAPRSGSQTTLKSAKFGEVAFSKAIKYEMAVAKQQAAAIHESDRIDDTQDQKPKEMDSEASMRTLLPVKSNRQASGQGNAKGVTSSSSVAFKQRKSSRVNMAAKASKTSNRYGSNTTLTPKSILRSQKPFKPAKISSTAIPSKASETPTASSAKSDSESSASEQTDESNTSDPSSQHSRKSTKEAASKATVKGSHKTLVSESALSYGKPLDEQAADLAHRLNSGNENFRRYNSVARNDSMRVPQKLSEGDRMTFWFSDAVLS